MNHPIRRTVKETYAAHFIVMYGWEKGNLLSAIRFALSFNLKPKPVGWGNRAARRAMSLCREVREFGFLPHPISESAKRLYRLDFPEKFQ